jgi:FkbM family methyltransferase
VPPVEPSSRAQRGRSAIGLAAPLSGIPLVDVETPIGSFWLDERDRLVGATIQNERQWSPELTAIVERKLEPGMRFVDVGANIGWFSVRASALVGEEGRVVSVEPDPRNVALLRANLWRNRCLNAEVLPIAGWSSYGHLSLVALPDGGAASEVSVDETPYVDDPRVDVARFADNALVPCGRLEDFIEPPVDLMKVDAQFTDHHAIRGLERTIRESPELTIMVEFAPQELARRGEGPERILGYYESLGFELWQVKDGEPRPTPAAEILRDGPFLDLVLERP